MMSGAPLSTEVAVKSLTQSDRKTSSSSAVLAGTTSGWRHHVQLVSVLCVNELRLRMRRLSSLIAVMAMIAISWAMIVDPQTGSSMMAIKNARVLYTSSALAMGSASLLSFLLALIGFYLVRGRIVEDLRSGIGSVIASTSVSNSLFLFSRWLGGVVYMLSLVLVAMCSIMVLHVIRGDGPVQVLVYFQTYLLVLGPMTVFAVSAAILFDSVPLLMGKAGDFLYFILWILQISIISKIEHLSAGVLSPWLLLDFSGLVTTVFTLKSHLFTNSLSLGASSFDPKVPTITLPVLMWSWELAWMRIGTAALAMSILLPAIPLFHRFSPDKVKASHARKRRSPLAIVNAWSRPLAKQVQALFIWAAQSTNFWGQVLADIALTLVNAPFSIIALLAVTVLAALMSLSSLSGLTVFAVAFWGILVSDISTRDFQAAIESMTAAVNGGAVRRYYRQLCATMVLGFLFVGVILFRLSFSYPFFALALALGIVSMSGAASCLGKTSKTSKTFMSLYLFTIYIATQATKAPMLDIFGFNGVATSAALATQLMIAMVAIAGGYFYTLWKSA